MQCLGDPSQNPRAATVHPTLSSSELSHQACKALEVKDVTNPAPLHAPSNDMMTLFSAKQDIPRITLPSNLGEGEGERKKERGGKNLELCWLEFYLPAGGGLATTGLAAVPPVVPLLLPGLGAVTPVVPLLLLGLDTEAPALPPPPPSIFSICNKAWRLFCYKRFGRGQLIHHSHTRHCNKMGTEVGRPV